MTVILNQSEFEHRKEISVYNNNYYRHKKNEYVIYEQCHEDENYYEFWLVENGANIFLGCSKSGFDGKEYVTIEFKEIYT